MRQVVILDQFTGPSPYQLQQKPMTFAELVDQVREHPEQFLAQYGQKPTVAAVEEDYSPRMATTVYAADEQGNAFVWKARWDTSG